MVVKQRETPFFLQVEDQTEARQYSYQRVKRSHIVHMPRIATLLSGARMHSNFDRSAGNQSRKWDGSKCRLVVVLVSVLVVRLMPCFNQTLGQRTANTCIEQLALAEAGYVVVRMLQTFGILESRDDRPFCEKMGIVLTSSHGVKVALRT